MDVVLELLKPQTNEILAQAHTASPVGGSDGRPERRLKCLQRASLQSE